jgi:3-dehydroquinate synthase
MCASASPVSIAIVTDETVAAHYLERVLRGLGEKSSTIPVLRIPAGERSKSPEQLSAVHEFLVAHRIGRDGLILALGGGVVSDLAGFAAATWMRGIDWVAVPTTLEAQIDASIGGKTAINIPGGKNLIGAFHLPRAVLIDPLCLRTLDPRDVRAGLAESVKHALITSGEFFSWHEQNADAILALDDAVLSELIERNVRIKADVVQRDPFERTGGRMTLNFGHTMGHAIEECCGYALRHGECVALGMLAACRISNAMTLLDQGVVDRVKTLLERFGLPTSLAHSVGSMTRRNGAIAFEDISNVITHDKKARGQQVQWVLLQSMGKTRITTDVDEVFVRRGFDSLLNECSVSE